MVMAPAKLEMMVKLEVKTDKIRGGKRYQ